MNSNSLLTTVFKNLQWALRKRGYWPTIYIMLDAIIALLSLPFFCSHNPNRSFMTVTKNLFSSSSCIDPEMDPIAQHSVFKFFQDHSLPFPLPALYVLTGPVSKEVPRSPWFASFSVM